MDTTDRLPAALPFWLSLGLVPLAAFVATHGGWTLILLPAASWGLFSLLDLATGADTASADPATPDSALRWHRAITLIWFPIEAAVIYGAIWHTTHGSGLSSGEALGLFFGVGILSGTIGITYAHELMHQRLRSERWLGDLLMTITLYGHFRSEHLRVHHIHVGTPRDTVSARYNEGFHRFFLRVLPGGLVSAFAAERAMLARRDLPVWHSSNPFWRYGALQAGFLALAWLAGGSTGVALFAFQALVAVWQLELVNYIEHYGLARRRLPNGRFEPVAPRHSWNASHRASNWLLINLQRHSDHHFKPDRRFPLLQSWGPDEAPQLPWGYPVMTIAALIPPLWRRMMNPRVRAWRRQHYPGVTDWKVAA